MKWYFCLLLAAVSAVGQTASSPEPLAIIEGRVVFAVTGEPVRKAHVSLDSPKSENDSELVATTDDAGHFRFADIRPGSYRLLVDKGGYLSGGYGEVQQGDPQLLLKIRAGDHFQDVVLRLFPAAIISGQVLDPDGDPVSGYEVVLWARSSRRKDSRIKAADQTTTDRNGQYRFDGLMPGTYYVSANLDSSSVPAASTKQVLVDSAGKPTNLHDYRTFFPSMPGLATAQDVHLLSGQEQPGVDIRLQRGPLLSIAGKVTGTVGHGSDYRVSASVDAGMGWTGNEGRLSADGSFLIADLPPGKHVLNLLRQGLSGLQTVGSTEVDLIDQNITGVLITQFEPASLRVRVTMEDEENPLTVGSVFLDPTDADGNPHVGQYQFTPDNGTYIVNNVAPGKYLVGFTNISHCFLKSVQSDGRDVNPEALEVASGAHLDLVLTYSKNVASLSGDVEAPQDRPKRPIHIMLLREDKSSRGGAWNMEVDQLLHFSIEDLRPEKYIAYATEEGDLDLWDEPDFLRLMRSEGAAIELHEKEHATLHLKLITVEATERVRRQLGL